jgi:hypothetical protein
VSEVGVCGSHLDVLIEQYLVVERDYSVEKIGCGTKDSGETARLAGRLGTEQI